MIKIIVITLLIIWTVNTVIAAISENVAFYISMGLVYPILWVLTYPIRAWLTYSHSSKYYQKHNITRLQYMFGKRVNAFKQDGDSDE